jgi:hypothetical protein
MRFLIAISIYACAAFAQPALPTAASRTVNLPVVGLASSETAQVNVASPGFSGIADAPLPTPCTGTIAFTNASGAAIGSPTSFSITLAQVSSATVPYSAVVPGDPPPTGNGRTIIRATVTTNAACPVTANMETFDTATGVTHVHVEGGSTVGIFPNLFNGR